MLRSSAFLLLMIINLNCQGNPSSNAGGLTNNEESSDSIPQFAEVLKSLLVLSESGQGFNSIDTGEPITHDMHTKGTRVSIQLPGATTCLISPFDRSYQALFGTFETRAKAKSALESYSKMIIDVLGPDHDYEVEANDRMPEMLIRYIFFDYESTRSSAKVALSAGTSFTNCSVSIYIPNQKLEIYPKAKSFKIAESPDHEPFQKALLTLMTGLDNNFKHLRGDSIGVDYVNSTVYALKRTLPGMKCEAPKWVLGEVATYCSCQSNNWYSTLEKARQAQETFFEHLLYYGQLRDFGVIDVENRPGELESKIVSKLEKGGINTGQVLCIYLKEEKDGYRVGIDIRDVR